MTGEPHPWLAKLWLLIGLGALLLEAGPAALAGAVAMVLTVPVVEQDLIAAGGQQTGPPPRADVVECPRCHLALRRAAPYGLPADVWLFECATCEGAWVRPADLVKFARHRQQRAARAARARRRD